MSTPIPAALLDKIENAIATVVSSSPSKRVTSYWELSKDRVIRVVVSEFNPKTQQKYWPQSDTDKEGE